MAVIQTGRGVPYMRQIIVEGQSLDVKDGTTYLELAKNFDLLVSGGSDFHGVSGRFPEQLGIFEVLYTNVKNVIEYKQ